MTETMNDHYRDGSGHLCCPHCERCLTCGDCVCEPPHPETDRCGFDRNSSHSTGHYVCECGWPDDAQPPTIEQSNKRRWNAEQAELDAQPMPSYRCEGCGEYFNEPMPAGHMVPRQNERGETYPDQCGPVTLDTQPTQRVEAIALRHDGQLLSHNDAIAQYNDLLDLARELARALAAKDAELVEEASTRDRMRDILTRTANELKGHPEGTYEHDWNDLQACVFALKQENRAKDAELATANKRLADADVMAVVIRTGYTAARTGGWADEQYRKTTLRAQELHEHLQAERAAREQAERLAYVPGVFKCAKCGCVIPVNPESVDGPTSDDDEGVA